ARERCALLVNQREEVKLDAPCGGWVLGNAGAAGFFRSGYGDADLGRLVAARAALSPEERVELLDDRWALVRAGAAPIESYLALLDGFRGERDRAVLEVAASALAF